MDFSVLGQLVVEEGGVELPIGGPKRRALLSLLLLHANRVVPAEQLIEDLWEGAPPESAPSTLQSHVYNLRRTLGADRLQTRGTGYLLEVAPGELDAAVFEAELAEGCAALAGGEISVATDVLNRALARWRGAAYAEVAGAPWVIAEASRLNEARAVALETLIEARLAADAHAEVVSRAETAVAEYPFRERLWAQLMTALYRQGRQADALRTYQRIRVLLGEELGIEPGAELRALENDILLQDPSVGPAPPEKVAKAEPVVGNLPSGVVTFLLTDVVGSTRLWDANPTDMAQALARHDALLRSAVETYGGTLLKARGEGDSTFTVFRRATDAVAAARAAQRALASEAWPAGAALEVRMALHTGEAIERDGDYFGPAVNRVARLRSVAGGGQVLVSRSTTEVVIDHLPGDCQLVELGPQELQDLARPETVYLLVTQIVAGTGTATPEPSATRTSGRVPLPTALASHPFAGFHGRHQEREVLARCLKDVEAGQLRLALLAGEPGIGKTALAAEVAQRAYSDGATVLYGRCDEDVGLPYRPWVEALGHLVDCIDDETLEAVGSRRLGELARLVPQVAERVSKIAPVTSIDPETERYLLFGAVATVLQAAGAAGPVVVVLDDLHWADKPTLSLLRHVVSAAEPQPLLVIGTYRANEIFAEHPLADTLAALRRGHGVERLSLTGLADHELVAVVESASGQQMAGAELDLIHAVHRETDGNPFFAWELILHLSESRTVALSEGGRWSLSADLGEVSLPDSVREVIGRRIARLGGDVQPVLATAAVIGRDFDLDLVVAALDTDLEGVLVALERAEAAGLVTSVASRRFMFSHALVLHTLVQDLSPTRRAAIHGRVAEAIEELGLAESSVTELARHWAAASTPARSDRAVEYARRSGEQALRALAPDEAVRWFNQALALLGQQGSPDPAMRCELLIGLGDAQRQIGDASFRQVLLEAAGIAQELGDTERLTRAALANTRGTVVGGIVDQGRVHVLEAAIEAIGPEDSPDRARLLSRLAEELYFSADHRRRRALAEEGVAVARRVGDRSTLALALYKFCWANALPDNLEQRRAMATEALDIAQTLGDPILIWSCRWCQVAASYEAADVEEVDALFEQQARLEREIGQPAIVYLGTQNRITQDLAAGRFDDAERAANEAYDLGVATGQPDALTLFGAQLLWIRWHQGRLDELLDLYLETVDSTPDLPALKTGINLVLLESGRADEVVIDLEEIRTLPYDGAWIGGLTLSAEVAARLGDRVAAQAIFELLAPFPAYCWYVFSMGTGAVAHYLGLLATVLDRYDQADGYFAQALDIHRRLGDPFYVARTQLAWGQMCLERGGPGDAERGVVLVEESRQVAEHFGLRGVLRAADAVLASPAAAPGPLPVPPRLTALRPETFVGRDAELRALRTAFEASVAGERRYILLAGEPGIGKTGIAAHFAAEAHQQGATVLYGRCDEDIGVPYQPWIEALGYLVTNGGVGVFKGLDERHLADLGRVVPEVSERWPDLARAEQGEAEIDRYLFYRAVAASVRVAATRTPVVVVIDDLHWADSGSLALLHHLAGSLEGVRVLIVATYRQSELSPDHALADTLANLRREHGVERLTLRGVGPSEITDFIATFAGYDLDQSGIALAQAVHRETDGNLFFAREILRHLAETGESPPDARGWDPNRAFDQGDLPESVREVVNRRVRRLGQDVGEALAVAAVMGREFDVDLLGAAAVVGDDGLLTMCEQAEEAGLVTSVASGRFAFVHALTQHALLGNLTPTRLARIHRRVAEAIETLGQADRRVAELAHHWIAAACDDGRALESARRAGDQARTALAPLEAIRWYSLALELLGHDDERRRCDLLVRLGRSQRDADDESFRQTLVEAARSAQKVGDQRNLVRAALANGTGYALAEGADPERAGLIELASRSPGLSDAVRARLLATLAVELTFLGEHQRRGGVSNEAVALARRSGDTATLVQVLLNWFWANWTPETLDERRAVTAEAVELAEAMGLVSLLFPALLFRLLMCLEAGDIAEARQLSASMAALAGESGQPRQLRNNLMYRTVLSLLQGDVADAEKCSTDLLALTGPSAEVAQLVSTESQLGWYTGDPERMLAPYERYYSTLNPAIRVHVALAHLEADRLDDARGLLELELESGLAFPFCTVGFWAKEAEVAAGTTSSEICRRLYENLLPYAGSWAFDGGATLVAVHHSLGILAEALGRHDDADRHLAVAEEAHRRLGAPFPLARTLLARGRTLLARGAPGDRVRATSLLEDAIEISARYGCAGVERRARALLVT